MRRRDAAVQLRSRTNRLNFEEIGGSGWGAGDQFAELRRWVPDVVRADDENTPSVVRKRSRLGNRGDDLKTDGDCDGVALRRVHDEGHDGPCAVSDGAT